MVGRFRSPGCCIYVRRGDHGSPGRERACGGIPPRFLALWDPRPGRDAATPSYCVLMWRAGSIAFLLVPLVGAFVGYVILESPWVDAAVVILDLFAEFRSGLPAGLRPGVVQSRRRRYFSVRHWPLCRAKTTRRRVSRGSTSRRLSRMADCGYPSALSDPAAACGLAGAARSLRASKGGGRFWCCVTRSLCCAARSHDPRWT